MLRALGYDVDMAASAVDALGEGATFPEIVLIDGADSLAKKRRAWRPA
jgi:hypothetical protein